MAQVHVHALLVLTIIIIVVVVVVVITTAAVTTAGSTTASITVAAVTTARSACISISVVFVTTPWIVLSDVRLDVQLLNLQLGFFVILELAAPLFCHAVHTCVEGSITICLVRLSIPILLRIHLKPLTVQCLRKGVEPLGC